MLWIVFVVSRKQQDVAHSNWQDKQIVVLYTPSLLENGLKTLYVGRFCSLLRCSVTHVGLQLLASMPAACADLVLSAAVRTCLEAPLHKRLDRRELVSLALVADASAERAEKVRTCRHLSRESHAALRTSS